MADNNRVIDLSEFQPDNIDWQKIKDEGYRVILRIGIRGSMKAYIQYYGKIRFDKKFHQFLAAVKAYNIPYSAYFFPTGINDEEANGEADWIIQQVRLLCMDLSFPFYLDSELVDGGNGRADKLSKAQRTRFLKIICDKLWAAGIPCGIYASRSWFYDKLDMAQFDQRTIDNTWCAQYADACDYTGKYVMWQYTSKAQVPGIPGRVDLSIIKGQFNMGDDAPKEEPAQAEKKEDIGFTHSRSAIVSEAISHIGVKEGTILHHRIIDRYNSHTPLPRGYKVKYTDPWCATFVSFLAIVMGYTDIIPVECSCPKMIELAKQMGCWNEKDSHVPKPGDIILYDWQDSGSGDNTGIADHIGIVEKVTGTMITVIEGNYKDAVGRREIIVNGRYIRGYIVPKYDDETASAGPAEAVDDLHTVKWTGRTKRDTKVYTQPDTTSAICSFSPIAAGEDLGVCKRIGKFYFCKIKGKYGYIHMSHIVKT